METSWRSLPSQKPFIFFWSPTERTGQLKRFFQVMPNAGPLKHFTEMQNRISDSNRVRCDALRESVVTGTWSSWRTLSFNSNLLLAFLINGSNPMSLPLGASAAWPLLKSFDPLSFGLINIWMKAWIRTVCSLKHSKIQNSWNSLYDLFCQSSVKYWQICQSPVILCLIWLW